MDKTPLPWYRESAFRAWVKKSLGATAAFVTAVASDSLPSGVSWVEALRAVALYSLADLLASAWDIWFSSPTVYEDRS